MKLTQIAFSPAQAAEIAGKARAALAKIISQIAPLEDSAKRHEFVLAEISEAERDARQAAGNDFVLTKAWTREATAAVEETLEKRCKTVRSEIDKLFDLATELKACIDHLSEHEVRYRDEILPAAKATLMMFGEYFEGIADRHFPSFQAAAYNLMVAHPGAIIRFPSQNDLSRLGREMDVQTSTSRDDSPDNRRRLADRHNCSTREIARIAAKKRVA